MSWRAGNDADWENESPFSVDPSAMPSEIETQGRTHDSSEPDNDGTFAILGIYELDGDSLRICLGISDAPEPSFRPNAFESTEETMLMVLRRVEEESE